MQPLKILNILICLLLTFAISAQDSSFESFPNNDYQLLKKQRTIALKGIVNIPLSCFVIRDSVLLVNEFTNKPGEFLISFWSLKSGNKLGAAIPVGRGPGEHLPPLELHVSMDTVELWDQNRGNYSVQYITKNLELIEISERGKFTGLTGHLINLNNAFIGSSRGDNKYHLSVYNKTGTKVINRVKYFDFEPLNRLDPALQHHLMDGCYIKHPSKPWLAFAGFITPFFVIYNVNDPQNIETTFEYSLRKDVTITDSYNQGGVRFLTLAKDEPKGARSPVSTNQYLYYLYLGVSPDNANSENILKINWNGRFENGYKLDEEIVIFTIHKGKIYAIDGFWENIMVYDMNP